MVDPSSKNQFESHLADIVDGNASVEILELIADDDALRDERHSVVKLVQLLSHAGADFSRQEAEVPTQAGAIPDAPAEKQQAPQPPRSTEAPKTSIPGTTVQSGITKRQLATWVTLGVAASIGVVLLIWNPTWKKSRSNQFSGQLSGNVTKIETPLITSRVEICQGDRGNCRAAKKGARVSAGEILRTNARAGASILFDGDTSVALERSTVIALGDDGSTAFQLNAGTIAVDASRNQHNPLPIGVEPGRVELDHAECIISNNASHASVEVNRGRVLLIDKAGHETKLFPGEVGRLQLGREVEVTVNRSMSGGASPDESESEQSQVDRLRGLGELRAKKPGENDERKNAVRLLRHHVDVHIVGAIARTEIDETFTNGTNEVLEGIFRFPLPADAQIERLALEVDGKLVDGAFVDRERASAIWRGSIVQAAPQLRAQIHDEIIWVPGPWRDPALLEWQRGNRFELRIYPIPKQGSRRVVLSYTQLVPGIAGMRRYAYPLPQQSNDSRGVEDFSLKVEMRGHDTEHPPTIAGYEGQLSNPSREVSRFVLAERQFSPQGDLRIEYALPGADRGLVAWAHQPSSNREQPYVALLLRPKLPRSTDRSPRDFAFVVDTSRSMYGESLRRATALTARMIRDLSAEDRVTLLACDSECRNWTEGLAEGGEATATRAQSWLRNQSAEGASDLTGAIDSAIEALGRSSRAAKHIFYLGDGTPTAGPTRPATIQRDVQRKASMEGLTLTAVALGSDADLESLRALARGSRGVVLPYVPGTSIARASVAALASAHGTRLVDAMLDMPRGFTAVTPGRFEAIAAGDELLVTGRLDAARVQGDVVLRGRIDGQPFEQRYNVELQPTAGEANAFVPRLFAAARIVDLERTSDVAAKAEAIELSRRFSVASRYTSLLVLESQAMFDAFGLDNRRKSEMWTGELEDSARNFDAEGGDSKDAETGPAKGGGPFGEQEMDLPLAPSKAAKASSATEVAPAPAAPMAADEARSASIAAAPASKPKAREESTRGGALSMSESPPSQRDEIWRRERHLPPRTMIPMRRVWERKGEVLPGKTAATFATSNAVDAAERELDQNPDRREVTKKLFGLYARSGALAKAADLAERWSQRDPLDVEALIARADIAARRGDRTAAIRILGSVVDVRPSDYGAQQRLSRLYRWQGQADRACRFSLSLAEFRPADEKALVDALRCLDERGRGELAHELKSVASESVVRAAERLLPKSRDLDTLSGDLRVTATWSGDDGVDLDLSLIDPDAHRVSWLGAPTRAVISAMNVTSQQEEGLALRGGKPGEYLLEISRGSGSGRAHGTVTVHVAGTERVVPFSFEHERTVIGIIKINMVSHLVPANSTSAWLQ